MKVYSWNMLFSNKKLDQALEFIRRANFDVFCLQEVPEHFLPRLQELPFHLAYETDVDRILPHFERIYLVTLSRHPIERQSAISFPDYWSKLPLRTRLFVHLMRPFGWTKIKNRNGMRTDLHVHGSLLHVFNLHLILAHPEWRFKEFELAMTERDLNHPTIVCGDFNILESPQVSILNWILGGKLTDALYWTEERARIENHFVSYKLLNPLRGKRTHPISRSQLDHILVSHDLSVAEAHVIPERYGSDHHPIFTCIEQYSTLSRA